MEPLLELKIRLGADAEHALLHFDVRWGATTLLLFELLQGKAGAGRAGLTTRGIPGSRSHSPV